MIPRLKPYLDTAELRALVSRRPEAVRTFERAFAREFEAGHALAFPYGRSALWSLLEALEIRDAEIILPAYTCVVVAHAVVLSGNCPRFVDVSLHDYNMDLDQVEAAISERTGAVIATHLFGYPLDVDRLRGIVETAQRRYGRKIWIVQDCAHSFGARWERRLVCTEGDAALFGLNISKTITSIFGGMITTGDAALASRLRSFRDTHFEAAGPVKTLKRLLYLLAVYPAFSNRLYRIVDWLQDETPLLRQLTDAYHLDEKIHFPPDYADMMLPVEARVGLAQLTKYEEIVSRRREHARHYDEALAGVAGIERPPVVDGATYSHYVVRVRDRGRIVAAMAKEGIRLGTLIQYSIPHMTAYARYTDPDSFPRSLLCSRQTVNLPVYAALGPAQRDRVAAAFRRAAVVLAAPTDHQRVHGVPKGSGGAGVRTSDTSES